MLTTNFHRTFVPERRHIGALLHYAALGQAGTYQEIGAETGIPMGVSTGKVPAIMDYALGMGLIAIANEEGQIRRPSLTALGRVVYAEDQYLGEGVTQWVAHANLCREDGGAEAWRVVFGEGRDVLGARFGRQQLEDYLVARLGPGSNRTGPLIRAYTDEAALGRAGVLTASEQTIERGKAPLVEAYATAHSALILGLMEVHFPGDTQVTVTDLSERTLLLDVCLWGGGDVEQLCALLDRKGYVAADRQMRPWVLEKRATADSVWPSLYDDLV